MNCEICGQPMKRFKDWSEAWGRPVCEEHWECENPDCDEDSYTCDSCGNEITLEEYGDNGGFCDECQVTWLEIHPNHRED